MVVLVQYDPLCTNTHGYLVVADVCHQKGICGPYPKRVARIDQLVGPTYEVEVGDTDMTRNEHRGTKGEVLSLCVLTC